MDLFLYLYQHSHHEDILLKVGNRFVVFASSHLCSYSKSIMSNKVIPIAVCTLSGFIHSVSYCCGGFGTAWWLLCSGE